MYTLCRPSQPIQVLSKYFLAINKKCIIYLTTDTRTKKPRLQWRCCFPFQADKGQQTHLSSSRVLFLLIIHLHSASYNRRRSQQVHGDLFPTCSHNNGERKFVYTCIMLFSNILRSIYAISTYLLHTVLLFHSYACWRHALHISERHCTSKIGGTVI